MLEQMKAKVEELTVKVEQAAAQHNYFLGALTALKEAVALGHVVAPDSPIVEEAEKVEQVMEAAQSAMESLQQ